MANMRIIEYRLIRPNGAEIWHQYISDQAPMPAPRTEPAIPDTVNARVPLDEVILPPWIYQRGGPKIGWETIAEAEEP